MRRGRFWRIRKLRRAAEPTSAGGKVRVRARGCEKRKDDKKGTFPQQREETPQKPPSPQPRELPKLPPEPLPSLPGGCSTRTGSPPCAGCPRAVPAHTPVTSPPSLAPPHPLPKRRGDPPYTHSRTRQALPKMAFQGKPSLPPRSSPGGWLSPIPCSRTRSALCSARPGQRSRQNRPVPPGAVTSGCQCG